MAEVFHFNECVLSGTNGTPIAPYARDVSVEEIREFYEITSESGQLIKRFESGKKSSMNIGVLYAEEIIHTDGQALDIHYANALGTTSYRLGSAYIQEKDWLQRENDPVRHDVKIVGRTFGTV